ncbi:hypothetical protein C7476_108182 [Phyllobacterium bourgognense]|uniref:Uncharacterized protein n=1 Tax=Phyllobacterium bourgognense TaxID=314236 RepID=A0A368YTT5_9HYPH|nr:hypothetical protein C7476_108182 [Phyllobacterium bourgognense]
MITYGRMTTDYAKPTLLVGSGTLQQPANINGQLLGLRSRQQRAVVECMQEARFTDPAFLFDDNPVHHGNLASRTAETQGGNPRPNPHGFTKRNAMVRSLR